jgi:hypothetical protein
MFQLKNKCSWKSSLNNFEDMNSTLPKAASSKDFISPMTSMQDGITTDHNQKDNKSNNGAPPTKSSEPPFDPDGDDSSSNDSDDSGDAFKDFIKYFKSKSAAKPLKKKKDKTEDEKYRTLVRNLLKSTKIFDIHTFNIHPDPITRCECFCIWVADLRNILSTSSETFWMHILRSWSLSQVSLIML